MRRILQFAALPLSTLLLLVGCGADHSSSVLAPPTANADVSMISMMKFAQDDWSLPVRLGDAVNTAFNEQGPTLSPDALSLYFCSNKPGGQGGNDIWVSHRASEESDWEPAVNLGPVINSQFGDCGPNISPDGHLLFFTSARPGIGGNDLYVSHREDPTDDLAWETPVRLGDGVNTAAFEFSPFFSQSLEAGPTNFYFERGPSNAVTHIFAAAITREGEVSGAAVEVAELNSTAAEGHVTVRADGREIFFHSNRDGVNFDIYGATRRNPNELWSTPTKIAALNTSAFHEIHPSLSRDGRTIVFTRGIGVANDIWMSTRAR